MAPPSTHPLLTAITDPLSYTGPEAATAFTRTKQAGASIVRLDVDWDGVAPNGKTKPAGFNPSDPADPSYQWAELDREVRMATAHGLAPMISISGAPVWAQKNEPHPIKYGQYKAGPWKPSPVELGRFAHAIATRYDGAFHGLPRVRYWRAWNET